MQMHVLFGFVDARGFPRKVAKLQITKEPDGKLRQLVVVQYDARNLVHFTLHYTSHEGKPPEYHEQLEHPELVAKDDRLSFPYVIDARIPDIERMEGLWPLQAIPVWLRTDIEIYDVMRPNEIRQNPESIADLRDSPYGPGDSGILETYLLAPRNMSALEQKKKRVAEGLRSWTVITDVTPWILGYMRFARVGDLPPV